jgi:hypothetical protein
VSYKIGWTFGEHAFVASAMRHIKLDFVKLLVSLSDRLSVDGVVYETVKIRGINLRIRPLEIAKDFDQLRPIS